MKEKTPIRLSTEALQARELEQINLAADELNPEAADVLDYQIPSALDLE